MKTIKYPKHLIFGVCVAFVLLSAFVGMASATTWYVEEGELIQASVNATNQGDELAAVGRDRIEVYQKAKRKYPKEEISICYIPTPEETVTLLKV